MTRLILSNGDAVNVNFASFASDFDDLAIHRVTTDGGVIIKPEADIYGEILAAQAAHFLASTSPTALLAAGLDDARNLQAIASARADDISGTIPLALIGGLANASVSIAGGLLGGPVTAGIGFASALVGLLKTRSDISTANIASAAYENWFEGFGARFEESITSFSGNISSLGDSQLTSEQVFNSWLAFVDATVTVPSALPLLRQFDFNLANDVPGIDDNFDVYTSTLNGLTRFTLSAYLESELTLVSQDLAARLAPLAQAAVRAESLGNFVSSLGPFPPGAADEAVRALAEYAQDQARFVNQLSNNGIIVGSLGAVGPIADAIFLINDGLDLLNAAEQQDALILAIERVGNGLDQLAGEARLAAAFAIPEGRADFVARASELPVIGTNASDTIVGSSEGDAIFAGDGNDTVSGGAGNDRIVGGAGNDSIQAGDGNDVILPGEGVDTVDGGVGSDVYRGRVQDLNGDNLTFEFGDRVELFGAVSQLPSFGTDSITVTGNRVSFDFDLDGSEDFFFISDISAIGRPVVVGETVDGNGIRTVIIQAGDEAAFAINQSFNSGLASTNQASFGGITASGNTFAIGPTNIKDGPSDPELRNLAVTDTGRVYTVLEYDAGENLSFGLSNVLPPQFIGDAGGVIVELDPETGAFIDSSIRAFAFGSGGMVPNTPPDFGVNSVESINALAPLGGGEFLAIAEFNFRFTNPIRTLEGGPDFAFKIDTSGNTEFLLNWSGSGDGDGTRTIAADTSPITGEVYAWRDWVNVYGGGVLLEVDATTGAPTVVADFFNGANASNFEITSIAFQSDGSLIGIGGDEFGRGTIFEIDPAGQTITPVEFIRGEFFPEEFDLFGDFQFKPETNGTSDDDTLTGTDSDDRIDGGLGNDSLIGLGGDDDIFAGGGTDVINPGLGNDIVDVFESRVDVRGTLAELDGDRIRGFDQNDVLTFLGTTFSLSNIFLSLGSLEVSIDADGDGTTDALVTLDGDFDLSQPLIVENAGANTTIRLGEINVAPSATDDTFAIIANEITFGNVLSNDTDGNDDELSLGTIAGTVLDPRDPDVQTVNLPSGAQIAFLLDGSFIYDPRGAFSSLAEGTIGFDTFVYTTTDGTAPSATATVTVEVTGAVANDAPVATDDGGAGFATDENTAFTTDSVLANDTDVDGDTLTVSALDTTGTLGLVTDNGDGTFDYNPNGAFEALGAGDSATDSFSYTVSDGNGGTDTATVDITVNGVAHGPIAIDDIVSTTEDTNLQFNILNGIGGGSADIGFEDGTLSAVRLFDSTGQLYIDNAGGPEPTFRQLFDVPEGGDAVLTTGGRFSFFTNGDYDFLGAGESKDVTFSYVVNDGITLVNLDGPKDTGNIVITVTGVNDAPVLDFVAPFDVAENTTAVGVISATDVDSTDLSFSISGGADGALFEIDPVSGALSFKSAPDFEAAADVGGDNGYQVEVSVSDGDKSDKTLLAISVTDEVETIPNRPPTVSAITAGFGEDQIGRTVDLLATANDLDGDDLDVENVVVTTEDGRVLSTTTNTATGLFELADGQFEDLAAGVPFDVTVNYDVTDGTAPGVANTATLTITGANDDPVGADDNGAGFATDEDTAFTTMSVLSNDADVDGDTLSVSALDTTGTLGLVTDNGDGTFDYDPNGAFETLGAGDSTTDSFSYTVSDGNGGTDTATVEITVNGVNDDPGLVELNGTNGRDRLRGTDNDELINGLSGSDTYFGRGGADTFVFEMDGVRDREAIRDFETGIDSILLDDDYSVRFTSRYAVITTNEDRDSIFVYGDATTEADLNIRMAVDEFIF